MHHSCCSVKDSSVRRAACVFISWVAVVMMPMLAYAQASGGQQHQHPTRAAQPTVPPGGGVRQTLLGAPPVRFEPDRLDLGTLAPGDTATGSIVIHNISDKWLTIKESRSSCTCTAINLANTTIAPGQAISFDVSYHAASVMGVKNNAVRILFDGYDIAEVPVVSLVSYQVLAEPTYIDALQKSDGQRATTGEIRLHALDGKPFRVLAVNGKQPVLVGDSAESDSPATEHIVKWDLSGFDWQTGCRNAAGERMPGWIIIETDHPGAPIFDLEIRHECNLRKAATPMDTWSAADKRIMLGVVKPGEPVEAEVLLRWMPNRERDFPPTAVMSESKQFAAEIISVTKQADGFMTKLKITPAADVKGLIYGALRLHSNRQSAPMHVIATTR